MLCDSHIHVGGFRDVYYSPREVYAFLDKAGVDKFAVSSTMTCVEDYDLILCEFDELERLCADRLCPILWIHPNMLSNGWLERFLHTGIPWRCLKVHGYFNDWHSDKTLLPKVVEIAIAMNVPLLFHTGGREESDSGRYADIIRQNKNVQFILAHSRPIEQTLSILKDCPNCYADTAFTPVENVKKMVNAGFSDKILFGTDYPLPKAFYPEQNMISYYHELVQTYLKIMSPTDWEKIAYQNFENIFKQ